MEKALCAVLCVFPPLSADGGARYSKVTDGKRRYLNPNVKLDD